MDEMHETVKRVLAGETEAFRLILQAYGPSVRAMLASHIPEAHTVDDLAQETFIVAYESLANFDIEKDLGAWIHGIARNKMRMHLRRVYQHADAMQAMRGRIAKQLQEEVDKEPPSDPHEDLQKLNDCMGHLSQKLRTIFHARYFEREKVMDIAQQLDSSVTAVSNLLFRGRKQLRDCLEGGQ